MPRPHAPIALLAAIVVALALPVAALAASTDDAALSSPPSASSTDTQRSDSPEPAAASGMRGLPTAAQVDAYLVSKGSPMAGQGAAFVASGGRWQVDPRLVVAIAGAESSFGQITCAPFNAWGWGCPTSPYDFESWADGIDAVSEGLRTNYLAEGRTTVASIHQKYAPVGAANDPTGLNDNWTINVSRFLVEQGGDPNDVDLDGIAGTVMLGPLGGASLDSYGFEDADAAAGAGTDPALRVAVGDPQPLVVRVRNTGYAPWSARDVTLRRIDTETRIVGAPYGALASGDSVEPGEEGTFSVQLGAVGSATGTALTRWQLEGPSGAFGPELARLVEITVPPFVATDPRVETTPANGGIAGTSAANVIVRVRNAGADTWTRDGDGAVLLGVVDQAGRPLERMGWINDRVAARMLEREAAPGEVASFVLRVGGDGGVLAMRPFRASGWALGEPAIVQVGAVPAPVLAQLQQRLDAATPR